MSLSADELQRNLDEWFPWAKWECSVSGGYCCVWAITREPGEFAGMRANMEERQRVARSRSWVNARNAAKVWAWRRRDEIVLANSASVQSEAKE